MVWWGRAAALFSMPPRSRLPGAAALPARSWGSRRPVVLTPQEGASPGCSARLSRRFQLLAASSGGPAGRGGGGARGARPSSPPPTAAPQRQCAADAGRPLARAMWPAARCSASGARRIRVDRAAAAVWLHGDAAAASGPGDRRRSARLLAAGAQGTPPAEGYATRGRVLRRRNDQV